MTTLVVSDLHLGGRAQLDLLRRPEFRPALFGALEGVDRLVLLGDLLEMRHGPVYEALDGARDFLRELGEHLDGRPVTIVPGNHDHHLIEGWVDRRRRDGAPPPLELEHRIIPSEGSGAAGVIADWLSPAPVELAYPGVWLRDDVYALHGHYIDRETTIPAYERIGARLVERLAGSKEEVEGADAYEATLAPIYALLHEIAQSIPPDRESGNVGASAKMWKRLQGNGRVSLGPFLLGAGVVGTVAILNRAGLGPLSANLSGPALRRASLQAMSTVLDRLDVKAEHVIFGHTHRAGPFAGDDASEWCTRGGSRLLNTGSWTYEPHFLADTPERSPYWPGASVVVPETGPPEVRRLLDDRTHAEFKVPEATPPA